MSSTGRRIALALGGGGARGYAHLGVVQELRDRGHEIVSVSGTSMGALIGGLTAANKEDDFAEWAINLKQVDVLRLAGAKWSAKGAITAEGALAQVERLVEGTLIEDLPVPFTAVATDLEARREVWFQTGPLVEAMRASIAIPGLFVPAVVDGRVLVDGGLLNPLPLDPTAASAADVTVAVTLQGPRAISDSKAPTKDTTPLFRPDLWRPEVFKDEVSRWFRRGDVEGSPSARPHDEKPVGAPDLTAFDIVSRSYDAMQSIITRYRLAALPPDVLITVPVDAAKTLDFHRAAELIDLGRELASVEFDELGL